MEQKETNLEFRSGLTPFQEQAAALLATGKTINGTAAELSVSRATIIKLLQGVPFLEYYNLLVKEVNMNAKSNLITLREKALESLVAALDNDNTALRLKVAMWILKEVER